MRIQLCNEYSAAGLVIRGGTLKWGLALSAPSQGAGSLLRICQVPVVSSNRKLQSERFLEAIADHDRFLILMHDNPDPDAIATGWALQTLIEEKLNAPVRLIGGGAIVRAPR